ncbi:PD-(D/E)XK nuclease family protein (plasmid) [Mesorhizobium muleiense]|uniref:PD-(D/E)XK nuclease family protein n=1 Tax=Mesorhizobium muleiense TaxID=1004279 RepID=UPI003AFAD439
MSALAVTSAATHRRIRRARTWLEGRALAEEVLIVGASLDAANELPRNVAEEKGAAFGWHRLTLPQLAAALAAPGLAERKLVPLSRLGAEAIVARVVHRLKAECGLGRYQSVADTPGFPRAIAAVLAELRLEGLPAETVGKVAPDLVPLIEVYDAELAEAGLTDWSGVLGFATEAASSRAGVQRLVGLPMLLLDVPIKSQAEFAFVGALAAAAPETFATVPAADRSTLDRIRDAQHWEIKDLDESPKTEEHVSTGGAGALARLQRRLFNDETAVPQAPSDNEVEVFSAPGEGRECVEIARRVLALARNGIPFDRIAVLLRSPEEYRAHLGEAFARAGIPAHFARGAVRPDPAGRAFYALLKCAAEGLSARRFAEYLSLGQVPDAAPSGAPPEPIARGDRWVAPDPELVPQLTTEVVDVPAGPAEIDILTSGSDERPVRDGQLRAPRRWERLLVEAAVIGGCDRWRRRIEGLSSELRLRLAEMADEDETRAATLARTLEDLSAFAGYTLPLIEDLDSLPAAADWGEWLDRLGALATRALRQPDRVLAVLAELVPMAPVGPVTLTEVLIVLESLLLEAAVPPLQRYGKVFIGPIEAARGLSFDAVLVPGLAEKMFPRKIIEEPILLDAMREQISGALATNSSRLEGERLALALAAGAAERWICFSYPRLDLGQARPRVPSFYALEAVRAAEGRLPDFAELARRAETATTARLGWPAPPDPAEAIDDAEHDLAVLDRLVALPGESAGAARYLVTANPWLARALRARFQRWSGSWTSADGLTSRSEAAQAAMARHALGARSYSPTALQNYARCPYKFFLQAIHGLAPREVPEAIDELDPLQRGSLIHDVQFDLFANLSEENLLPVRPGNLDRARQLLEAVISKVAGRYRDDLAPAIDRVWEDGIAAIRADLREWLRRASEDDSGYVPWHFELSFGLEHRPERHQADPQSVTGAVDLDCGIQLRGSIDLVERHPAGQVRVTDHKTGKADGKQGQLIDGGKSLQPLLYALAAEKLFAARAQVTCGRLYFCTSTGGFVEHVVLLTERARDAAQQVAEAVGEAVAQPFLPAAPDKGQCDLCDYRVVCGPHEERRTARKPQGHLQPLLAVRVLP